MLFDINVATSILVGLKHIFLLFSNIYHVLHIHEYLSYLTISQPQQLLSYANIISF